MNSKKRIALITTWFPPKNRVAVNRMYAFAKYLSVDYEVEVFTEGEDDRPEKMGNFTVHYLPSDSFLNGLKHKTDDTWLRHNFITAVDVAKGLFGYSTLKKWVKKTLAKLLKRHAEDPFDLVISSFSPFEPHLVAIDFVKQTGMPWIADMRDEMSQNPFATMGEKRQLQKQEKEVGKYATALTSVSHPILEDFKRLLPQIGYFEEIRNGFDHDLRFEASVKNEVFTIGYFGNFYGKIKPDTFFQAVEHLILEEDISIKVKIIGAHKTFKIPHALDKVVELFPPIPYNEALKEMSKSDANLLIHPSGMRKGVYTGKLFDYISVGKPVIGVIDKADVAAELIRGFDCGYIADFYDVPEIQSAIRKTYGDWEKDIVRKADKDQIAGLHRKKEVEKLSKLIAELTRE